MDVEPESVLSERQRAIQAQLARHAEFALERERSGRASSVSSAARSEDVAMDVGIVASGPAAPPAPPAVPVAAAAPAAVGVGVVASADSSEGGGDDLGSGGDVGGVASVAAATETEGSRAKKRRKKSKGLEKLAEKIMPLVTETHAKFRADAACSGRDYAGTGAPLPAEILDCTVAEDGVPYAAKGCKDYKSFLAEAYFRKVGQIAAVYDPRWDIDDSKPIKAGDDFWSDHRELIKGGTRFRITDTDSFFKDNPNLLTTPEVRNRDGTINDDKTRTKSKFWENASRDLSASLRHDACFPDYKKSRGGRAGRALKMSTSGWVSVAAVMEQRWHGKLFGTVAELVSTCVWVPESKRHKTKPRFQFAHLENVEDASMQGIYLMRAIGGHSIPWVDMNGSEAPFDFKTSEACCVIAHRTTKEGLEAIFRSGRLVPGDQVAKHGRLTLQLAGFLSFDPKRQFAAGRLDDRWCYELVFDPYEIFDLLGDKIRVAANGVLVTSETIPISLVKRIFYVKGHNENRRASCFLDRRVDHVADHRLGWW